MRIISILLFTFFIISCTGQTAFKKVLTEEDLLTDRVKLFWEAKQKNDWDAVKELIAPDLREELIPYINSQKSRPNMSEITSCNIEESKIDGGNATVITKVTIKLIHPLLGSPHIIEQTVKDQWVKKGSSWYIMMVKPDLAKILKHFIKKEKGGEN
jgi:hypothetical protein